MTTTTILTFAGLPLLGVLLYFIISSRDHFGPEWKPFRLWKDWKWVGLFAWLGASLTVFALTIEPEFAGVIELIGFTVQTNGSMITLGFAFGKLLKEGKHQIKPTKEQSAGLDTVN